LYCTNSERHLCAHPRSRRRLANLLRLLYLRDRTAGKIPTSQRFSFILAHAPFRDLGRLNRTARVHDSIRCAIADRSAVRLDGGNSNAVGGALVALLDGDNVMAERLSSASGTATLSALPGIYRVRVRRIGFRPFVSDPVTLPLSNELLLHVESQRIVLDAMVVSAKAQCGAIRRDAQTLSAVWDEITKALRASQITQSDFGNRGLMLVYKRELGKNGEVVSRDSSIKPITGQRPFGVPDVASLVRLGYVRGNEDRGWEYFGPDEAVLLSDEFAATHCFQVVRDRKKREGQIGVAFEPAPDRMLSDIKGVLWVDEKTAELRDIGFAYVNAGVLTRFEPGGFSKFRRVPSGTWVVSEWQLRMPRLEMRYGSRDSISQIGMIENGGFILGTPGERRGRP
jgi:hypothetical protein